MYASFILLVAALIFRTTCLSCFHYSRLTLPDTVNKFPMQDNIVFITTHAQTHALRLSNSTARFLYTSAKCICSEMRYNNQPCKIHIHLPQLMWLVGWQGQGLLYNFTQLTTSAPSFGTAERAKTILTRIKLTRGIVIKNGSNPELIMVKETLLFP
jgi:hypothetical protein